MSKFKSLDGNPMFAYRMRAAATELRQLCVHLNTAANLSVRSAAVLLEAEAQRISPAPVVSAPCGDSPAPAGAGVL